MADQKLNEISQVQSAELADVKTFLAVMNNGEIKQMSKEDMASVVGGLLKNKDFALDIAGLIGISRASKKNIRKGESISIETNEKSPYILSIYASEINTEYIATFIISWASIYAADIVKLSEYSYTKNITIEVSRTGNDRYVLTYKSGNLDSINLTYSLRQLLLQ